MKMIGLIIIVVAAIIAISAGWWFWGENVELIEGGSFSATTVTQINPNTVSLALGDILLFKTPTGDRGAIRFDRMTNDWGADYTTWFTPAGSTNPPSKSQGHVFEKYWRTRTGKSSHNVKDIGGDYRIECGHRTIGWSASTWLYIPDGYMFAVTANSVPDFAIPDLKWHTSNDEKDAQ